MSIFEQFQIGRVVQRPELRMRRKRSLGALLAADKTDVYVYQPLPSPQIPLPIKQFVANTTSHWQTIAQQSKNIGLFRDPRDQQLEELTGYGLTKSDEERETERYLAISTVGLGLATVTTLLHSSLVLASIPFIVYSLLPLFRDSYRELTRQRHVGVATVIAITCIAEMFAGLFAPAILANTLYFVAEKLLFRSRTSSRKTLIEVFQHYPRLIWVVDGNTERQIPFEQVQVGDTAVVGAGEVVPIDGTIIAGTATIDQRALTGEAQPAEKESGDTVFATTIVLAGRIYIRVEQAGSDTAAAQIGELLNQTANMEPTAQLQGAEFAERTAGPALLLSVLVLPFIGPYRALAIGGTVLADTLRFSTPISMLSYLSLASKGGILIKDGHALEDMHGINAIVFDKTGTLTAEQPTVTSIVSYNGLSTDAILTYAATAEQRQSHPIALAILHAARERNLSILPLEDASYQVGFGLIVRIEGQTIRVGSIRFMRQEGITVPATVEAYHAEVNKCGNSLVLLAINEMLAGSIELQPAIRPEARDVIQQLRERGIITYVISGDHELPTAHLARELDIHHYYANTLPQEKASLIEHLQELGHRVCFVGDGINDAIALQQADVSISLKGASTAATDAAQIVLMDGSLQHVVGMLDMARAFDTNTKLNIAAAVVPAGICLGGIFFLNWGLLSAVITYNVSIVLGLGCGFLPLAQHRVREWLAPTGMAPVPQPRLPATGGLASQTSTNETNGYG